MKVFIYGASGHGKVIGDIVLSCPGLELAGFLDDDPARIGTRLLGAGVLPAAEILRGGKSAGRAGFLVGIGDNSRRMEIAGRLEQRGLEFATAIHPDTSIGREVEIGDGTVVMAGAVINSGTRIGRHVIINTGAVVDHDCRIGDFAHISPGSALAGGVTIGDLAQVGIGSSVLPGRRVGRGTIVGGGSVVISDIPDGATVAGVPARHLKGRTDG